MKLFQVFCLCLIAISFMSLNGENKEVSKAILNEKDLKFAESINAPWLCFSKKNSWFHSHYAYFGPDVPYSFRRKRNSPFVGVELARTSYAFIASPQSRQRNIVADRRLLFLLLLSKAKSLCVLATFSRLAPPGVVSESLFDEEQYWNLHRVKTKDGEWRDAKSGF